MSPVRYFVVIGLHPGYTLVALAGIVVVGAVTLWLDPGELDSGLGMILFAQMFLASTGFVSRARQGHFDPLLVGPWSRVRIVMAHWIVSIGPGIAAWLVLVCGASLAATPGVWSAVAGFRAASLVIVSALSWTIGFWLPRGAAGMLWMALLMVLVTQRAELLAAPAGTGPIDSAVRHIATLIVCPFLLLADRSSIQPLVVYTAVRLSIVLLVAVWRRARALDIYLVDRS